MYSANYAYEASVLVNGRAVTEVEWQTKTFIEGRKDSVYELQFHNKSPSRVLVIPSVDGLSVIDGKPAGMDSSGYVVNPYEKVVIPGWKVDGNSAAKFVFKPQGGEETYVEAIGQNPINQGVIGFLVFTEKELKLDPYQLMHLRARTHIYPPKTPWPNPQPWNGQPDAIWGAANNAANYQPDTYVTNSVIQSGDPKLTAAAAPDMNSIHMMATGGSPDVSLNAQNVSGAMAGVGGIDLVQPDDIGMGTGFGEATKFNTYDVTFERARPTIPDAIFVFYYDSLRGLKKRGVPVERFNKSYVPTGTPNPFPTSPSLTQTGCPLPPNWKK